MLKALAEVARVTVLTVPQPLGGIITASTLAVLFGSTTGTTVEIILTPDPGLLDGGDTVYALVNPMLVTFGRPPAGRFCERIWRIFNCRNALVRGQCDTDHQSVLARLRSQAGMPNNAGKAPGGAEVGAFEARLRDIQQEDRKGANTAAVGPPHGDNTGHSVKPSAVSSSSSLKRKPIPIDPARCDKLFGKGKHPQHGGGPIHTEEIPDCAAPRPISEWEYSNDGFYKCRNATHWLSGCLRYKGDG